MLPVNANSHWMGARNERAWKYSSGHGRSFSGQSRFVWSLPHRVKKAQRLLKATRPLVAITQCSGTTLVRLSTYGTGPQSYSPLLTPYLVLAAWFRSPSSVTALHANHGMTQEIVPLRWLPSSLVWDNRVTKPRNLSFIKGLLPR